MRRSMTIPLVLLALGCGTQPEVRSSNEAAEQVEPPRSGPPTETETTPQDGLHATIEWAIEMLEQKKHLELIEGILHPEDKAKAISEEGSIQAVARQFGADEDKPRVLLQILRVILNREPVMEEDGTRAIFELADMEEAHEDVIVFDLVDGRWCIRN
jgi:hypothetical protein